MLQETQDHTQDDETTTFFKPYCTFFKNPYRRIICNPQDESLYSCYGLASHLNREFQNIDLKQIFEPDKVAIAAPCHRKKGSQKTSAFMSNLLFSSLNCVPPHLRKYVKTDKCEIACFINTHHPKITNEDLKSGYFIIIIGESHFPPQKLYCAVFHELSHLREHFYPKEVDRMESSLKNLEWVLIDIQSGRKEYFSLLYS